MVTTASNRRFRIAYVVHDYHRRGGHSRYVAELAQRFKRDHDVHVFANTFGDASAEGLTLHRVPAWRPNALATILSFVLPATMLVGGKFDIVHAQGLCGLRQNVVTAHICQPAWHQAMARHAGPPAWRKRLFQAIVGRLESVTYRRGGARRIIAVSERIREDLKSHYRRDENVSVIYHGVDTDTFHPRNRAKWRNEIRDSLGLSDSTCLAPYVGDLQKAIPAAIKAVAMVEGVHLMCVSATPATLYENLAGREGIGNRVHFLPATTHVERYYAAADFFVFPTFYDSFGMVATEAMASGLPVICSRNAGAAELIQDGVNGLVVEEPWNVEQLAAAISRLATDKELCSRLAVAARRMVEQYTWDEVARRTMAVYQDVVGQ